MIKIEFLCDHRTFKAGEVITLDGNINILVGDQGVGKSTLLELIAEAVKPTAYSRFSGVATVTLDRKVVAFSHDYEKENVRGGHFGMSSVDLGTEVAMLNISHGQAAALATRNIAEKMASAVKNGGGCGMLILDEPDAGLSIRSSHALAQMFKHIGSHGHFVVASIHNYITMSSTAVPLYDVELRKYVTPTGFLERMLSAGMK